MRKLNIVLIILFLFLHKSFCQNIEIKEITLYSKNKKFLNYQNPAVFSPQSREEANLFPLLMPVWPINPVLVYENKKVNFGLTKEISMFFPFIYTDYFKVVFRSGLEYSYIFRSEQNHHLRGFFNADFPLEVRNFVAFTAAVGGGYFTNFKKTGIFPQASFNMLIPFTDKIGINPYIKLRHTFMLDKMQSDITDFSLGIGFFILPFSD